MMAWLREHKIMVGNLSLVLVMLLGLAYLAFGSLSWRPWQGTYDVTVHFPQSGGLQETSKVMLRGSEIGHVRTIQVTPTDVVVTMRLDDDVKINKNSKVSALGLSGAGEQYVNFTPTTNDGPFLEDGSIVQVGQTHVTVAFSSMLQSTLDVVGQIDPPKLTASLQQLEIALNDRGPNQLKSIFHSGGVIFADLAKTLPQTTKLIQNLGTIFKTTANAQPDLDTLAKGFNKVATAAANADGELRQLLGRGPAQFSSLAGSLSTISDPLADLVKQFADIARQGALRAPTMATLFPSIRDGSVQAQKMFHDGAWWALASIYPRPSCNYSIAPTPPTQVLELTVPKNLYCVTNDPTLQTRGAANAPRPKGDDTAGPPPNYDPNARTVPLDR
ncbi:MlaD family protein [Gordonia malaquae]|jgi:phospholipid/cholesterol/gamma-HCH transport system substrate-binding protein|uniref:Mce family protein n=1 Tax=Gordonia malaquae NBRC 108250 TaxID=1223542 RepID=M3VA75_GORML|nr:Mce family protein [Gordonia malaquae NBRC 108250]SED54882.1 virulence factor Mce family protein [Gordonia malaquae]